MTGRMRRGLVAVLLVTGSAVGGGAVLVAGGRAEPPPPRPSAAPPAPWVAPGPGADAIWWAPVHGEPLGLAVDAEHVAVAALDEVRLLDARDGHLLWKAAVPGVRRYRPAVGADRVAATSETELVLLARADGARVATVPFAGPGPAAVVGLAPGEAVAVAGSETGAIVAVDAATGAPRWAGAYPGSVTVAPRGDGAGGVVVAWHRPDGATLRVLDGSTGAPRWEAALGVMAGAPATAPGPAPGTVVVADGGAVASAWIRALDARTGALRWQTAVPGWFDDELEPAISGDAVHVLDGTGTVTALDLAGGAVRWQSATGRLVVDGRVVVTRDGVVFAGYHDEVVVLDRATGRVRSVARQGGVPVDVAATAGRLLVALRLGAPSRVEARPEP